MCQEFFKFLCLQGAYMHNVSDIVLKYLITYKILQVFPLPQSRLTHFLFTLTINSFLITVAKREELDL